MSEPALAGDNYTYEKDAIINYIQKHGKSPITSQQLLVESVAVNDQLKQEIDSVRNSVSDENRYKNLNLVKNLDEAPQEQEEQKMEVEQQQQQQQQQQTTDQGDISLDITRFENNIKISIRTPVGTARSACDICCVIDVSGSMQDEARIKNEQGDVERNGLSILDLVKHSVKTIISNLNENDRLSLVAFHTQAYKITDLTFMNEDGKKEAYKKLEELEPLDSTNIWDGIYQGLEVMKAGQNEDKKNNSNRISFSQILLFTDGQPNIIPPRGHLPMLKKYKEENDVNCSISTFGFGYNLDSSLLDELAIEGRGSFAFIPDGQFVGTVFVNALSNLMTTIAVDAILCVESSNGTTFEDPEIVQDQDLQVKGIQQRDTVLGNYDYQKCSWGLNINVGSLQYGQSKDIVVRMKGIHTNNDKPYLTATLKYKNSSTQHQVLEVSKDFSDRANSEDDVLTHVFRLDAVTAIRQAIINWKKDSAISQNVVKQIIQTIKSHSLSKTSAFIQSLLKDLEGQVTEALSKQEYYQKWGSHYLRSLSRAHQIQQCNNFKDPGVQHYGGKLFNSIRDIADEAFLKMPAPQPSIRKSQPSSYYSSVSSSINKSSSSIQSKKINMRSYYNNSAPCFDGDCLVQMANGQMKKVKDIRKNDLISSPAIDHQEARVACVVRTPCVNNSAYFVEFEDGLIITPYHPIRVNSQWVFPCDLKEVQLRECDFIYSFVLENGHSMKINGVECVTYAHNFQEDVVKHDYFGTEKIINDLQKMNGWKNGYITLSENCLIRDPISTLVIGLVENQKIQTNVQEENQQIPISV